MRPAPAGRSANPGLPEPERPVAAEPETGWAPLRAWDRFWHTGAECSTVTLFRIALGLVALSWGLSLGLDLQAFYSQSGLLPDPDYAPYRLTLSPWLRTDAALAVAYTVLIGSAVAVISGRGFRVAAVLLWLMVSSFQYDNPLVLNGGDILLRILCSYAALYALFLPWGSVASGSRPAGLRWRELFRDSVAPRFPAAPIWLLRLVQIQLTLIYPLSLIDKFRGDTWLDGTATIWALNLIEFERFPLPPVLRESLLVGNILTYGVLATEFVLPFLLWTRRTRLVAVSLGVGLHLVLNYALRLGFFGWIMVVAYLAFLTPSEARTLLLGARRVLGLARRSSDRGAGTPLEASPAG